MVLIVCYLHSRILFARWHSCTILSNKYDQGMHLFLKLVFIFLTDFSIYDFCVEACSVCFAKKHKKESLFLLGPKMAVLSGNKNMVKYRTKPKYA